MRGIPVTGLAVLMIGWSISVLAAATSPAPYPSILARGMVIVDNAQVRSGPSDAGSFYVTNILPRGSSVEITAEKEGGWLEIIPPAGSISFINELLLSQIAPGRYRVTGQSKVPVLIGSEVYNHQPTVIGTYLVPGAQVISRGNVIVDAEGKRWMPIEAPAQERRFIRSSDVLRQPSSGSTQLASNRSVNVRSGFAPTLPLEYSNAPMANPPASPEQLFQQAQQAERAGQLTRAIPLYHQAAGLAYVSNPALYQAAQQRARFLEEGPIQSPPPQGTLVANAVPGFAGYTTASRSDAAVPAPPAVPSAHPGVPAVPARESSSFLPQPPTGSPPRGPGQAVWTGYRGYLRPAGRVAEGQRVYALCDPITLAPILYATPGAGINLEPYLHEHAGRILQLHGYALWRSDWRNNYMVVTRVLVE